MINEIKDALNKGSSELKRSKEIIEVSMPMGKINGVEVEIRLTRNGADKCG